MIMNDLHGIWDLCINHRDGSLVMEISMLTTSIHVISFIMSPYYKVVACTVSRLYLC